MKKLFYGFGGLSYSVISQTMTNFFMFFATSVLGIKGSLVGVAIAISTIWDGLSDNIFGYLSDNKRIGRLGYRRGYMLIATIGMSISNIFLWCIPNTLSISFKFVWILISLLVIETFNTMFSTPYMALGTELASSYSDRTKINAFSTVFFLIGIIIPSILLLIFLPSTDLYPIGQLNPHGYVKIAITTSLICLIFGLLCTFCCRDNVERRVNRNSFEVKKIFAGFLLAFKNSKLKNIIFGYMLTSVATVFLCSVGLHFFTYSFFYSSKQITFLLVGLMLGTIFSQPMWVNISKKHNKKPALVIGILLTNFAVFGVIFIYIFRVQIYNISFYLMLVFILICGIGSGALYSLPTSLYGDAVSELVKNGDNNTATYTGTLTFASNIANSITQLVVGVLLDIINFDSSMQVQTLGVQMGLALIVFIGVQFSLILSCLIFSRYKEPIEINTSST